MKFNNGFEDALKQLKTVANVNKAVTVSARKNAAEYFASVLRPLLAKSSIDKKHMEAELQVVIEKDRVLLIFGEDAWYWYLVEHGHKKRNGRGRVPGKNIIKKTADAEKEKLEKMMADEVIKNIF